MNIKKLNEQLDEVMLLNEEKSLDNLLRDFLRRNQEGIKVDISNDSLTVNDIPLSRILHALKEKEQGNYTYKTAEELGEITVWGNGNIDCCGLGLTSLEGAPEKVEGNFDCSENKLTSLKDAPKEVKYNFICCNNKLTSLEGCPQELKGSFVCSNNELTTLEGGPRHVEGHFDCRFNKLTSLEHAPEYVGRKLLCSDNAVDLN